MNTYSGIKFLAVIFVFTFFTTFSRSVPVSKDADTLPLEEEEEDYEDEVHLVNTKRVPEKSASANVTDTKTEDYDDTVAAKEDFEEEDPTSLDFESLDDEYENEENSEPDEEIDQMTLLRTLLLEKQI